MSQRWRLGQIGTGAVFLSVLVIGASCTSSSQPSGREEASPEASESLRIETTYLDAECVFGPPPEVLLGGRVGRTRGVDIDGDLDADIVASADGYYFRSAAFEGLRSQQEWVFAQAKEDADLNQLQPFDLVLMSELGRAAEPLRFPPEELGPLGRARDLANAGLQPPQRVGPVVEGEPPNATIDWSTDDAGEVTSASVQYDDPEAFFGVKATLVSNTDETLRLPETGDAIAADRLPAVELLATSTEWVDHCAADGTAPPTPEQITCAEAVVGDATVGEWLQERGDDALLFPREC